MLLNMGQTMKSNTCMHNYVALPEIRLNQHSHPQLSADILSHRDFICPRRNFFLIIQVKQRKQGPDAHRKRMEPNV